MNISNKKTGVLLIFGFFFLVQSLCGQGPGVLLNERDFRDRVFACWLGKNIGGTLGMPFEGKQDMQNVSFYTDLKPGEPAANDDLDLQLLWLLAMEERGGRVDARILGEYWKKYVIVDWNEYGIGIRNMRLGFLPPLSGHYDNRKWMHSNGAWIRSEIWACLAPGCPGLAAAMAWEDACVDHGVGEGTLAEIFTAAVESAAFIEKDRDRLIAIGLSMIPRDSELAGAIRAAVGAKKAGKDWRTARLDVIRATERTGWFQAPRNVAFMLIGWLYGDGDFGKSITTATNCGDDTDCTPATLGSILGIVNGKRGIPEEWSQPIGLKIRTVAIGGFAPPDNIEELTDRTVAMTKKVLALHGAPVSLTNGPSDLSRARELKLSDPETAQRLWARSPFRVVWNDADFELVLDYLGEPEIKNKNPRALKVSVRNTGSAAKAVTLRLTGRPDGWGATGLPFKSVGISGGEQKGFDLVLTARGVENRPYLMGLEIKKDKVLVSIPLTLIGNRKKG
jgi:ADP-ribosylglycohydrolase